MAKKHEIDPALLADVNALTDRVHEMLHSTLEQYGHTNGPEETIHLRIPRAWLLLAAWLEQVERERRNGRVGPAPVSVLDLNERRLRRLAKRWVRRDIHEQMHSHLRLFCKRSHWHLSPLSEVELKRLQAARMDDTCED